MQGPEPRAPEVLVISRSICKRFAMTPEKLAAECKARGYKVRFVADALDQDFEMIAKQLQIEIRKRTDDLDSAEDLRRNIQAEREERQQRLKLRQKENRDSKQNRNQRRVRIKRSKGRGR